MPRNNKSRRYYPAFLDLEEKRCVVIGGGRVAERKVRDLLRSGASVSVVSPELTSGLERMKNQGLISHKSRRFRATDISNAFLAIAATNHMETNRKVASHSGDTLVNVVDEPDICSFIVPSSLRRGPLTIAVSTSGSSPAMARAIRQELEGLFGKDVGAYLEDLCQQRERAIKEISDPKERKRKLKELGSPEVLSKLLKGRRSAEKKRGCK